MGKSLTTDDFIKRSSFIHNGFYDYSKVEYRGSNQKVDIICRIHGLFKQTPSNHFSGKGCAECSKIRVSNFHRDTLENFISKSISVHGNKYDYSKSIYFNWKTKIEIICKVHGPFFQLPWNHKNGKGCSKCLRNKNIKLPNNIDFVKRIDNKFEFKCHIHGNFISSAPQCDFCKNDARNNKFMNEFLEKSKIIHGNRYDYSLVEYKRSFDKVKIICKIHGIFHQSPHHHKNGRGCSLCNLGSSKMSDLEFKDRCSKVHNGYYNYDQVVYRGSREKVKIICPVHGEFYQEAYSHLHGRGCIRCVSKLRSRFIKNSGRNFKYNRSEIVDICNKIHNGVYDYSKFVFNGVANKMTVICSLHGDFDVEVYSHMNGTPCSKCSYDGRKTNYADFLIAANNLHNNKYQYLIDTYYVLTTDKIKIKCPDHGMFEQLSYIHMGGSGCTLCKTKSRGHSFIKNYLTLNNISFIEEKTFDGCVFRGKLRYDFYLSDYNLCIEYDGHHHFRPIEYFGGVAAFEMNKYRDDRKNQFCLENKINLLRISYKDLKKSTEIVKNYLNSHDKFQT